MGLENASVVTGRGKAVVAAFFLLASFVPLSAQTAPAPPRTIVYFFWAEGCPHCEEARPVLDELTRKNPHIELRPLEITQNEQNRKTLGEMAGRFGFEVRFVPITFIGNRYWVGYSAEIFKEIEEAVGLCATKGCPDGGTWRLPIAEPAREPARAPVKEPPGRTPAETVPTPSEHWIDAPLIGRFNLDAQSLWISTSLIALVDGFNPCSLWVLSMLLALVLHTGSRRKVLIVGFVFLTVTSLVYVLFIAGLFSVMRLLNYYGWVQGLVAAIAAVAALINIKDYFWFEKGLSLTIPEGKKAGLFGKMRGVMGAADSFWGLIATTVVLSGGVSLIEFSCTAGFPVLWVNLVSAHGVTTATFLSLLALYMIIYQFDEMIIFLTVVLTLRAGRFEEKQGRILKLVGGSLMLVLAIVMIFNPGLMKNLVSSLVVFGISLALTGLVLMIHRVVLPFFGIRIAMEQIPKPGARGLAGRKPT